MSTIKVLLVDDHRLFAEGLEKILSLEDDIRVVGKASNGTEAIEIAKKLVPDVVVMDINMPSTDGIEACSIIRDLLPETQVIALTVCEEEDKILQILKAGARGYFLKDVEPERLIDAIKKVQSGQSFIHPQIVSKVLDTFTSITNRQRKNYKDNDLTYREMEVVKLVAKGLCNKEIAAELYISEKTVKNHITNILRKLNLRDRVQVAIWAIKEKVI